MGPDFEIMYSPTVTRPGRPILSRTNAEPRIQCQRQSEVDKLTKDPSHGSGLTCGMTVSSSSMDTTDFLPPTSPGGIDLSLSSSFRKSSPRMGSLRGSFVPSAVGDTLGDFGGEDLTEDDDGDSDSASIDVLFPGDTSRNGWFVSRSNMVRMMMSTTDRCHPAANDGTDEGGEEEEAFAVFKPTSSVRRASLATLPSGDEHSISESDGEMGDFAASFGALGISSDPRNDQDDDIMLPDSFHISRRKLVRMITTRSLADSFAIIKPSTVPRKPGQPQLQIVEDCSDDSRTKPQDDHDTDDVDPELASELSKLTPQELAKKFIDMHKREAKEKRPRKSRNSSRIGKQGGERTTTKKKKKKSKSKDHSKKRRPSSQQGSDDGNMNASGRSASSRSSKSDHSCKTPSSKSRRRRIKSIPKEEDLMTDHIRFPELIPAEQGRKFGNDESRDSVDQMRRRDLCQPV